MALHSKPDNLSGTTESYNGTAVGDPPSAPSSINLRRFHDPYPEVVLKSPNYNSNGDIAPSPNTPTTDEHGGASIAVTVIVPIVLILFLVILTFTARRTWKRFHVGGRMRSNTVNNVEENFEEQEPLKQRENQRPDMQIVQEAKPLTSSRSDSVESEEHVKSKDQARPPSIHSLHMKPDVAAPTANGISPHVQLNVPELERPKTLKFLAASVAFQNTTVPALKRLPYTPDPDYVLTDGHYSSEKETINEERDKIAPLCMGMKIRSKPRGLLERRGSNVALTISLRSAEKSNAANPLTSKSPKPLTYLRQASSPLLPEAIHSKACDTLGLQQEFWDIPMNHPSEKNFNVAGHGTKNRYRTILPNEHSRVILSPSSDDDALSTYINANYIRNCAKTKQSSPQKSEHISTPVTRDKAAFIATQGPMANTIEDFWRMIWQEKARSIVMITKLKERKEKCSLYLPMAVGESKTYDEVTVVVAHIRQLEHFAVRTFDLTHSNGEKRLVNHFWYTTWMDHETPEKTRGLLELVQEVSLWAREDHGPVAVHCSAGIGRTGCFIAVSVGCEQLLTTGKVDILRIVSQMRLDRGGMIQTWEQYQFVHQALSRYARILAGENVTTPSTTGSVRSPPIQPPKTPQPSVAPDPVRPGTPKHRRSSSGNDLPASKELKVGPPGEANHVAPRPPSPDRVRTLKKKSMLRLAKIRDNTPPATPLPSDETRSPKFTSGVVAKGVSSPTIRSPFARLCLQTKDMNRSASPLSSVKFEWPDPNKAAAKPDDSVPQKPAIAKVSDENGAKICSKLPVEISASPTRKSSPSKKQQFCFDLQAPRLPNTIVCNGSKEKRANSGLLDNGSPTDAKSSTPSCTSNSSHFVFPVPENS